MVHVFVVVEIRHWTALNADTTELLRCGERLVEDCPAAKVAQLEARQSTTAPDLDVLELDDAADLAVEFDPDSLAEFANCDHVRLSPVMFMRTRRRSAPGETGAEHADGQPCRRTSSVLYRQSVRVSQAVSAAWAGPQPTTTGCLCAVVRT